MKELKQMGVNDHEKPGFIVFLSGLANRFFE